MKLFITATLVSQLCQVVLATSPSEHRLSLVQRDRATLTKNVTSDSITGSKSSFIQSSSRRKVFCGDKDWTGDMNGCVVTEGKLMSGCNGVVFYGVVGSQADEYTPACDIAQGNWNAGLEIKYSSMLSVPALGMAVMCSYKTFRSDPVWGAQKYCVCVESELKPNKTEDFNLIQEGENSVMSGCSGVVYYGVVGQKFNKDVSTKYDDMTEKWNAGANIQYAAMVSVPAFGMDVHCKSATFWTDPAFGQDKYCVCVRRLVSKKEATKRKDGDWDEKTDVTGVKKLVREAIVREEVDNRTVQNLDVVGAAGGASSFIKSRTCPYDSDCLAGENEEMTCKGIVYYGVVGPDFNSFGRASNTDMFVEEKKYTKEGDSMPWWNDKQPIKYARMTAVPALGRTLYCQYSIFRFDPAWAKNKYCVCVEDLFK